MTSFEIMEVIQEHFRDRIQLGTFPSDVQDIADILGVSAIEVAREVNQCAMDNYAELDAEMEATYLERKVG